MTSLSTLIVSFAVAGLVLTVLTRLVKRSENLFWTFLQHFCGVWFVFSGLVKAVDPIGTAYKMQEYFTEFESTFAGLVNGLNKIAPLFPWLSKYSTGFSILMIVLEIALGVMLIVGWRRKLTAWMFFILVVFFTKLTGYTYLTGYMSKEANFFDFAKWGPWVEAQMRATDCGCFGDFIKLSPRTSFFKDLGLMIPALLFVIRSRWMHQLFTPRLRNGIVLATVLVSLVFCWRNTYWDLPAVDFRPFKKGANIRERKALEDDAKVDVLGWVLTNDSLGQTVKYMEPEPGKITYYKQYPKTAGWKVKDQIQTDWYVERDGQRMPITKTKVSEFAVEDGENGEVTEDLLAEEGLSLMIVAFHLEGAKREETLTVQDTTWTNDTIRIRVDSFLLQPRVLTVSAHEESRMTIDPDLDYADVFRAKVNPLAEAAQKAGWKVYGIVSTPDSDVSEDFREKIGASYPFYKADDKLLKTITRSNPGLVVLHNGVVIDQLHWRHLPGVDTFLGKYR